MDSEAATRLDQAGVPRGHADAEKRRQHRRQRWDIGGNPRPAQRLD